LPLDAPPQSPYFRIRSRTVLAGMSGLMPYFFDLESFATFFGYLDCGFKD
jgi:hypothetical protein